MSQQQQIPQPPPRPTVVIKVGSSSICQPQTKWPQLSRLACLIETIVEIKKSLGWNVVLVSSGAIAYGRQVLSDRDTRADTLAVKQALAAIGQGRLMALYDNLFGQFQQPVAQVLLTRQDIADRSRYLNACTTLKTLLSMNVVPIVNENDTVSSAEIRFGDNDTLSAITAGMVGAKWLFLLTDVEALFTDNPLNNPDAKPILQVDDIDAVLSAAGVIVSSAGSSGLGTGGMTTKILAARLATAAGVHTVVQSSQKPQQILRIIQAEQENSPEQRHYLCTVFTAQPAAVLNNRKWWILHGLRSRGVLKVDGGAADAICDPQRRASLFAAGIRQVDGDFHAQEAVSIVKWEDGVELARGIVNYSSNEIRRVMGRTSAAIVDILGYCDEESIVHRDNLVIVTAAAAKTLIKSPDGRWDN